MCIRGRVCAGWRRILVEVQQQHYGDESYDRHNEQPEMFAEILHRNHVRTCWVVYGSSNSQRSRGTRPSGGFERRSLASRQSTGDKRGCDWRSGRNRRQFNRAGSSSRRFGACLIKQDFVKIDRIAVVRRVAHHLLF